jgi:hypothetical protein
MPDPSHAGAVFLAEARRQLDGCLDKIHHCADQLDESQLWWRLDEGRNSVGNLLLHLAGNIGQRFGSTIGGDPDRRDRAAEFAERGPIAKEDVMRRLDASFDRARAALDGFDPDRVADSRTYPTGHGPVDATVLAVALRSLLHLAGHTQEIIAMTKNQLGEAYRPFGRGDW